MLGAIILGVGVAVLLSMLLFRGTKNVDTIDM